MLKPNEIREIITRSNDYLRMNPDRLQVFIDAGNIACRGAASLSYEYQYTLTVIVQDFPEHADLIVLPLLVYLRTNQPELFENPGKSNDVIKFDIEFLTQSTIDLMIKIDLTERVIVATDSETGRLKATHIPEPEHPEFPNRDINIDVYDRPAGTFIGRIHCPAWLPEF